MFIYKYKEKKKVVLLITSVITGFILLLISPGYGYIYEAGRVITTIGIFGIVSGAKLKDNCLYLFMRNISTITYFMHLWILSLTCAIVYKKATKGIYVFLIVLAICIFISIIYESYKSNVKNKKQALE